MINRKLRDIQAYCSEDISHIENYQDAVNDKEQMWECHHRAEILPCGRFTAAQLKKHGLYWHRPARELIFLRHDEHRRLHMSGNNLNLGRKLSDETKRRIAERKKGKSLSDETKRKISDKNRGKPAWNKGKPHSLETRRKMSASQKNRHSCGANWRYL